MCECGLWGGPGAHSDPLSPSRLQGGHGGALGRQAFWGGAWRVGYGGTGRGGAWDGWGAGGPSKPVGHTSRRGRVPGCDGQAGRVRRALSPGVFPPRALLVLASFTESLLIAWGFPGDPVVNNVPAKAGDTGSIPGLGRFSERRKWQPTPGFLPGKSHAQGSLAGYSPWGGEESDRIGRVNSGSS